MIDIETSDDFRDGICQGIINDLHLRKLKCRLEHEGTLGDGRITLRTFVSAVQKNDL